MVDVFCRVTANRRVWNGLRRCSVVRRPIGGGKRKKCCRYRIPVTWGIISFQISYSPVETIGEDFGIISASYKDKVLNVNFCGIIKATNLRIKEGILSLTIPIDAAVLEQGDRLPFFFIVY
ncbi:MAG: hypothetical protein GY757_30030 [bacterium]|nr:hypothetical protein [bacterium]